MSYKPPPYTDQPGVTPASYYQPPPQGQQYPPQQQMYPPMPQPAQQSTVIITTSPSMVPVGPNPTRITCPSCHAEVLTNVKHEANTRTHCWAIGLCLIGCWPFCIIPYCMDSCQNANHYCPNCSAYIGNYNS